MFKRIKVKEIVKMLNDDFSQREIELSLSVSRNSIAMVKDAVAKSELSYETILSMDNSELYSLLFPRKFNNQRTYAPVDYQYVESELKRVGVTLKLLHSEYVCEAEKKGLNPCGYSKFCKDYSKQRIKKGYTSHFTHRPGVEIEVDYSGATMFFYDGRIKRTVYLFVGTLPFSQYTYVEPVLSLDQMSFLSAHINMFEFFNGTPIKITCDNLKTGVIEHPRQGEIVLNNEYLQLAEYYKTAIIPTGVRRPKEKPSVEGTVGKIETQIIAKLRNNIYYSFESLKYDIEKALHEFNSAPFQKREGSRESVFLNEELSTLRKLPNIPYEVSEWEYKHKVAFNSHVCFRRNWYSVPFKYIKEYVNIKYNKTTLYVYYRSELIAKHSLFPSDTKNMYSTDENHLDKNRSFTEWSEDRILNEASKIGDNTLTVITILLYNSKIKEQAFDSALAILKLKKQYPTEMIEASSMEALKVYSQPRYKDIKTILESNQVNLKNIKPKTKTSTNLRGSSYYKEK